MSAAGARGMTWADFVGDGNDDEMSSEDRHGFGSTTESDGIGFRIASMTPIIGSPVGEWIGTTDSTWATATNWFGVPGATTGTTNTDTATFNLTAPNSPLTIDAGRNIKNITFDTANVNSMAIGTTGGSALLLTADGTVQTTATVVNPQTINCPLVLEGDYTFTSGAANSAATLSFGGRITPGATSGVTTLTLGGINAGNNTIGGVLADNGAGKLAVAMAGPGVWILSGASTFSGNTTVTGGKLILKNSVALQMSTLSLAIDNGVAFAAGLGSATLGGLTGSGTLALQDQATTPAAVNVTIGNNGTSTTYGGILSGAGSLTKVGAGTLLLAISNTYTGGTSINAGTLQLGDGTSVNGSVPGNITDKATLVFANPNSQTYSGVISGAGSVAKTAAGTLVLSGANSFTGGLSIQQGTLVLSGANSFTGGLSVQQGTLSIPTINNVGTSGALGAGPSVSLGSTGQTGALEYTGGTASSNMQFSLAAGGSGMFQVDTASTSLSLSGVVSGSGALSKSGPGTLILSGSNTFTGGLVINAGMVQLGNSGALNSTTPNPVHFGPSSSGILNLGGSGNVTISSLQSNTVPGSPIVENANSTSGQVLTLTVNDSGTDTFAGVMRDDPAGHGILAIGKSGAGTLVLTAANTYTGGTTINAGTLQLGDGLTNNGSVAGDIADNSALVFADPNAESYSGAIFGSGSVTKTAPGSLTLSGSNSFTGGLTVQQGTLSISTINTSNTVGSLGASSSVTLSSNGQTATLDYTGGTAYSNMPFTLTAGGNSIVQVDSAATNLTLAGLLSGGGNLTKTGAGTLTFGSRNTYAGSTTVNNGTLATTTTGGLGGGSLVVNGNSGATSTLSLGSNQTVASLSGTVVAGSSARVNVGAGTTFNVAQATNTTFAGAVALANGSTGGAGGALNKSGVGTLEIDGGLTLGNNSVLAVSGGKLRLNVNSGTGNVGSGATANISGSAVLELAGSVSALGTSTPGNRVTIINTSSAAAGLLVSAGPQQVGGISGNGKTQINPGASLTADHIIQNALIISGTSVSHAVATINASDTAGNPLGQPSGLDSLMAGGAFDTGVFSSSNLPASDGASLGGSALSVNNFGDSAAAVPEPTPFVLILIGLVSLGCRRRRGHRS